MELLLLSRCTHSYVKEERIYTEEVCRRKTMYSLIPTGTLNWFKTTRSWKVQWLFILERAYRYIQYIYLRNNSYVPANICYTIVGLCSYLLYRSLTFHKRIIGVPRSSSKTNRFRSQSRRIVFTTSMFKQSSFVFFGVGEFVSNDPHNGTIESICTLQIDVKKTR